MRWGEGRGEEKGGGELGGEGGWKGEEEGERGRDAWGPRAAPAPATRHERGQALRMTPTQPPSRPDHAEWHSDKLDLPNPAQIAET